MSKKRTSPESSNDEQTTEGSDSVFQQDNNAKRAKLTTFSDTTLEDLPMELIECILIKAVAMEVEAMKLAKSVWKEKADLVANRLGTVCSQWSSIIATNFFRNELHRTLDGTAEKTIRLEILHQSPLQSFVCGIATLKDEIFLLCFPKDEDYHAIHVYDRNDMAEVKDVIRLGGIRVDGIAACNVSNCVYILHSTKTSNYSILRIAKDDQRKFHTSLMISDLWMIHPNLSVTSNGSLILLRWQRSEQHAVISMYNANGSFQREIRISSDLVSFRAVIPNSTGNLVVVSYNDQWQTNLLEFDMNGSVLRQYQSSVSAFSSICHADIYGRMLLTDELSKIELFDSEFNPRKFTSSQPDERKVTVSRKLHYNRERDEAIAVADDALTIFHFTEE